MPSRAAALVRMSQESLPSGVAEALVTSRIPVKVIAAQKDGTLILNYGNVFFGPGDRLAVYSVGEVFVDPDTGEKLDSEDTELGVAEVTKAKTKFSRAKVVGESFEVKRGSTLKRVEGVKEEEKERERSGADWDSGGSDN